MEQLRAIWRCPSPSSCRSRSTSLILRMDNLGSGNLSSPFGRQFAGQIVQRRYRHLKNHVSFRYIPITHSDDPITHSNGVPKVIGIPSESLIDIASEWVIDMRWNQ